MNANGLLLVYEKKKSSSAKSIEQIGFMIKIKSSLSAPVFIFPAIRTNFGCKFYAFWTKYVESFLDKCSILDSRYVI